MDKLPKKLKSGRRLVATAADRNVGLYCQGKKRREYHSFRILTRAGKLSRGMMGSAGYPVAPNDLKWKWLHRKRKQRVSKDTTPAIAEAVAAHTRRSKRSDKPRESVPSAATICVECKRSVLPMKHAHTLSHPFKGYAQTFCCRCIRKVLGYKRQIRIQDKIKRKLDAAIKAGGGTAVVVGAEIVSNKKEGKNRRVRVRVFVAGKEKKRRKRHAV